MISANNVTYRVGKKALFEDVNIKFTEGNCYGLIGANGAGKSTLLKIITGSMPADDGLVTFAKDKTFGYLAQHQAINSNHTIYDELLTVKQEVLDLEASIRETELAMKTASDSELELLLKKYSDMNHRFEMLNGYAYKSEITGILKGLGFQEDEFDKKVDTLSGGQKTRIALGKLLLQKPDLIMLDEPTNHLDLNSIAWLETYLLNYKGAVLIVSHDRYFLDKIATKIIEIDNGTVTVFHGNYSDYARQKEVLRTERLNAYLNQQREIKHQEEVIDKLRSFNREKSIKRAESREKMLDKIERLDKPVEVKADMKLKLTPRLLSGNDVLSVSDLSKTFDNQVLFSNVSFEVKRGEHVAIIGDNGTGKTTLLKIINELVEPDTGTIRLGSNVQIGYYDQEHHVLHMEKTLFEEISDAYPDLTNTQIRNTLAAFLFTGEDVFKKISSLSGGERGRVSLAKLMLSNANFLILDEPTTGLDPQTRSVVWQNINDLRTKQGLTVFLTTHYMEEASDADYVVILDSGLIVGEGTPHELKSKYARDYIIIYNAKEENVALLGLPYEAVNDGFKITLNNTNEAKELILKYPQIFNDFEIVKGKMDDVFLNITGKKLGGGSL